MATIGELIAMIDVRAKDVDPNYVGFDNCIPTSAWVAYSGTVWRQGDTSPMSESKCLSVFFIAPQEDGMVNVYAYPTAEKDQNGRLVRFTRYSWMDPPAGTHREMRVPVQVEVMSADNWIAELVEELLAHSDTILERDAARTEESGDEEPEDEGEATNAPHAAHVIDASAPAPVANKPS